MRDLFDQLVAEGEDAINALIAEQRQESVDLEFKTKSEPAKSKLNRDDRQNLGIILSALSNSMGGLVIWGIEARKNGDGVDCATAAAPIRSIANFKSEVSRLISQVIMPRHDGIRVEAIAASALGHAGYLLIHVERSDRRPHRCEVGEKQYFKRVGDSSIAMEHYDIEDSFKRLVVPWLEVEYRITSGSAQGGGPAGQLQEIVVEISVRNPSPVTARFPYLILEGGLGNILPPGGASALTWNYRAQSGRREFAGGADDVIHPGLSRTVVGFGFNVRVERQPGQPTRVPEDALRQPFSIAYWCGCFNSRQTHGTIVISPDELLINGVPGLVGQ